MARINCTIGTIEQMIAQFNKRISELSEDEAVQSAVSYDDIDDYYELGGNEMKVACKFNGRRSILSAEDNRPVRLHVEWYPYSRYGEGAPKRKANFSADNMMEALAKLADRIGLYIDPEDIIGIGDYPPEYDSPEEVIKSIATSNGDGCDYITLLQNRDTGEILINTWDEEEEEDWD